jgi:hypothetical protein
MAVSHTEVAECAGGRLQALRASDYIPLQAGGEWCVRTIVRQLD